MTIPEGRWRVGRSIGRTLYIANGPEDAKTDIVVGMMCGPEAEARELAELVCRAVNLFLAEREASA